MNKTQLQKYNTIIINDKFISPEHQATYIKSVGGYNCTIKKSNNKALVSVTDLLDYCNQLINEGTCKSTVNKDTLVIS